MFHPLAVAPHRLVRPVGESEPLEEFFHPLGNPGAGHVVEVGVIREVLPGGEPLIQGRVLGEDPGAAA